ncbi:MAG: Glycyl-tRNA synthetase, partial [Candidatus Shapirobacteria bacterium GW2011_GWE2_38_30]
LMSNKNNQDELVSKIISLTKRRGIVFQNSEIYGGIQGFYDYGPIGSLMKKNWKDLWWNENVIRRRDVFGIDGSIITHPKVWEASGHVKNFGDELVECKSCHKRFRPDLIDNAIKCPECNGEFTAPRKYNILFHTEIGVIEGEKIPILLVQKYPLVSPKLEKPLEMKSLQKTFYTGPANSNNGIFNILSNLTRWINGLSTGNQEGWIGIVKCLTNPKILNFVNTNPTSSYFMPKKPSISNIKLHGVGQKWRVFIGVVTMI